MNIRDHGLWERYTPEKPPGGLPTNTMFVRRSSDGVDWYDYIAADGSFAEGSIKIVVTDGVVSVAATEADRLFPQNARVLEIGDVATDDPQKLFGRKVYDADRKTFSDPPPRPVPPDINDLLKRLEALEGKA